MSIIFFGSSKYSTIVEQKLHQTYGLSAVVTIPDRAIGRKQILTASPVKQFATQQNIPCITTDKLDAKIIAEITSFKPDFLVVADYGLFLPDSLLAIPKYMALNVHHSLLPKYRGPSPAPSTILAGEKVSGVSIIEMSNKLDAGDIVAQKKYTLKPDETTESLLTTLNTLGSEILIEAIEKYIKGTVVKTPQDEKEATFTPHMSKQDGYIDLENPPSAKHLDRMIRAYSPWPSVWGKIRIMNKELRIMLLPGKKIQVEGKKPVSVQDFVNGYPDAKDIILPVLKA